jgi:hypothetical protein
MDRTSPETLSVGGGFLLSAEGWESDVAVITITMELHTGRRVLTANSERSAASFAEAVTYSISRETLPVRLSVRCADPGVRNRLTEYLLDLQTECLRVPFPRRNASGALR